jgi:tetratricopeptide (TPR) repeat protein
MGPIMALLRKGLSVCLALLGLMAMGAEPARIPVDPAPAIALAHRAEQLKAAFRAGEPGAIRAELQEVELLRRTYGTLDVLPLVEAMAVFARQLGLEGQTGRGLQVLKAMEPWAPGHPTLLGTRVQLMRLEGLHGYLYSIPDLLELTRGRLLRPDQRWLWLNQHLAWLRVMATLLLWTWALAMAARYRRVLRYLWDEPLKRHRVHRLVAALVGALLLTFPVLLGLDPSVAAMLWLWLMGPFLLPVEVRITFALLLLQLVHPALGLMEPLGASRPAPSIVTLQLQPRPLPEDPRIWAALAPGDREYLAGWRQLEGQQWAQAETTFRRLAASHPDRGAVLNNLGVAQFQLGQLAAAQATFNEAGTLLENNPEILMNQSVVAFKLMDSILGTAKQEEASRASRLDYERMLAANQSRGGQRTFAIPMSDTPARIRACAAGLDAPATSAAASDRMTAELGLGLLLPLLAAAALVLRLRKSVNQAHPSQCARCGDPFHTTDSPDLWICSRCHHLFILKDGLHAESRKRKVDEVAAFQSSQRWVHRLLLVLLPGADRCFMGDTRPGCVELAFFCFALAIVIATGRPLRYPAEILADPASTWVPLGLALIGLLYLRSWAKLLPRRH